MGTGEGLALAGEESAREMGTAEAWAPEDREGSFAAPSAPLFFRPTAFTLHGSGVQRQGGQPHAALSGSGPEQSWARPREAGSGGRTHQLRRLRLLGGGGEEPALP